MASPPAVMLRRAAGSPDRYVRVMDPRAPVTATPRTSAAASSAVLTFMRAAPGMPRPLGAAQQAMLAALRRSPDRLAVTGVVSCRTALDLAERGLVTVTDGNLTRRGGAGVIAATDRRRPATGR
jgi:hypothetical protein